MNVLSVANSSDDQAFGGKLSKNPLDAVIGFSGTKAVIDLPTRAVVAVLSPQLGERRSFCDCALIEVILDGSCCCKAGNERRRP